MGGSGDVALATRLNPSPHLGLLSLETGLERNKESGRTLEASSLEWHSAGLLEVGQNGDTAENQHPAPPIPAHFHRCPWMQLSPKCHRDDLWEILSAGPPPSFQRQRVLLDQEAEGSTQLLAPADLVPGPSRRSINGIAPCLGPKMDLLQSPGCRRKQEGGEGQWS